MSANAETGARDDIVVTLFDLFRRAGYDAVSIADISDATGLGKSSLYHHFPGGKPDMAQAVADFARNAMRETVFDPLAGAAPSPKKIAAMMKTVSAMYEGGGAPCLIASMLISPSASARAVKTIKAIVADWIDAIADALAADGVARPEARRRATQGVIAIQGALVVARALGDRKVFAAALKSAEKALLGAPARANRP
ncbi:MAG: TetR/AcrR family transcriptional regulator [Parvularculaceae bacterium]|nr:TetR/AcrR family transcriptional regulator [Parvularculaceae bacterium]